MEAKRGATAGLPIDLGEWTPAREGRIEKTESCWLWTGTRTSSDDQAYGQVRVRSKSILAHRAVWTALVGPIPVGMTLDHLCRVRLCVNPDHLEPVTHAENVRRGYWGSRTHCRHGHPWDEANTRRTRTGKRECWTCRKARGLAWWRAHRQKVAA